jgi:cupin 2 domain-containing protein
MAVKNLFADLPQHLPQEQFDQLMEGEGLRLERIVSTGQATPEDQWYDQEWDEWVVVLRGSARLQFVGPDEELTLHVGDHVHIPARRRHRVVWTDSRQPTVWLALHYRPPTPR